MASGGVAASLVLACSLTSLDGFSDGKVADASATDVLTDATPTDGAPNDAGDGSPATSFCTSLAPAPTFCDDFERVDLRGAWDKVNVSGGATLVLQASTRSKGVELFGSVALANSGGEYNAELTKSFVTASEIRMSFAFETDAVPSINAVQTPSIYVTSGISNDAFAVYLMTRTTGITIVEQSYPGGGGGGIFDEHSLSPAVVFGTRQRIEIETKLAAPPQLTVRVDGAIAYLGAANAALKPGLATAAVGIHYGERPGGPLSVHVDDVAVYVK